jgi:hypothetical protein
VLLRLELVQDQLLDRLGLGGGGKEALTDLLQKGMMDQRNSVDTWREYLHGDGIGAQLHSESKFQ